MKICCVVPQGPCNLIFQPIGLAYVVACIEKKHEVTFIDCQVDSLNNISFSNFDVILITIPYSASANEAYRIALKAHEENEKIKIIAGGPHACVQPEECLKFVDIVIVGEGEKIIPILLERNYKNGIYKVPFITDLDSVPFPARHLLPMSKYFSSAKKGLASRNTRVPWTSIITSRGCPYNCIFCSIHLSMGRKWRYRSAENVIEELDEIVNKYKIGLVYFEDDNFTYDISRVDKICELIINKRLKFEWSVPNGIRPENLNKEILIKMKKAGCKELWFAPESGVQRVINEVIGKKLELSNLISVIHNCIEVGIQPCCFFVIGSIGETLEEMKETVRFAKYLEKLGVKYILNIATPLYGTRLYNIAKQKCYLRDIDEKKLMYNSQLYIDTPEFKAEDVLEIYKSVYNQEPIWYTNIKRLIKKIFKNEKQIKKILRILRILKAKIVNL